MPAVPPRHALPRDVIVDALWPDTDVDAARNNLHQVVHAARRAIETVGIAGADALAWNDTLLVLGRHCRVVTDVEQLDAAAKVLLQEGDVVGLAELLEAPPSTCFPRMPTSPGHSSMSSHIGNGATSSSCMSWSSTSTTTIPNSPSRCSLPL